MPLSVALTAPVQTAAADDRGDREFTNEFALRAAWSERSFVQNWSNVTTAKMVHNDLGHIETLDATTIK
jgi:hypothetical protein